MKVEPSAGMEASERGDDADRRGARRSGEFGIDHPVCAEMHHRPMTFQLILLV